LLFALALAVQLIALYAPRAPSEGSGWGLDKVVHAALFAAVVWTGRRAGVPAVWLVVICAVHAPVSELVQAHLLPHRDGTVGDALADLAGVAVGALLPIHRSGRSAGRMDR
jgi:VanZ family protein